MDVIIKIDETILFSCMCSLGFNVLKYFACPKPAICKEANINFLGLLYFIIEISRYILFKL